MLALALLAAAPPPITIADILQVTDIGGLAVSPDGRLAAFRTERPSLDRDAVETRWYVVPIDGSAPARAVADGGDALHTDAGTVASEAARWLPDGGGFLFRAARDGAVQVWRADLVSGRTVQVTRDEGDVARFAITAAGDAVDYVAEAPRHLLEAAERSLRERGGRVDDGVDLSIGLIGGSTGVAGPASVRMTGAWFGRRGLLGPPARASRQPLTDGPLSPTTAPPAPLAATMLAPDERRALCARLDCARDRPVSAVPIPGSDELLVTTVDAGQNHTLWRWRRAELKKVFAARGFLNGGRALADPCAVTRSYALCVAAAGDLPPRLVRVSLSGGAPIELYAPNAELARRTRSRVRPFAWIDGNGRRFTGQLILPATKRPARGYPLVLHYYWCHGFLRGGVGDELPMLPLAEHGVASLCVNRNVIGQAKQDTLADYRVAEAAIAAAVDRLARDRVADRARIGMQGVSFGSETTMWIARRTRLLRAAAIGSGQLEPSFYWHHARPGRDVASLLRDVWGLGHPDRAADAWARVSPARDAGAIGPPLLLQLPESEARWSIELFAKLRGADHPVDLYVYPDAAHVKARPRQKEAAYERNLAWFRLWLDEVSTPTSDEPGRAARWAGLLSRDRGDGSRP